MRLQENFRRGLKIVEDQRTDPIRAFPGEQAQLETDEADAQIGAHRAAKNPPGIGAQPRRQIHRQHRQAAGVHRGDRRRVGLAHLAGNTGAQ